jgi:transcriptional regulator NrdR family protein
MKKIEKKVTHRKIEVCSLCKKDIETDEDAWTIILDLLGNETRSVKFYHSKCMSDLLQAKGKIISENFQNKLKDFTQKMFGDAKAGTFSPEQMQVNLDNLSK